MPANTEYASSKCQFCHALDRRIWNSLSSTASMIFPTQFASGS